MSIKSKVVGIVAAGALTLSMFAGAAADTSNTGANITLRGTACTVSVSNSNLTFGAARYDGTEYVINTASNEKNITWNVVAGDPAGCDVSLKFNGLTNTTPGYTSHKIGLEHFTGTMGIGSETLGPIQLDNPFMGLASGYNPTSNPNVANYLEGQHPYGLAKFPTMSIYGTFTLNTLPDDVMPGTYSGTIESTVTNGQ